ncbi:hypothetical protein L286_23060 [Sphingobium sp. HDIP04]|nr:hypothetical protein L286_23060 [Sphingobium sp. HDIP04]
MEDAGKIRIWHTVGTTEMSLFLQAAVPDGCAVAAAARIVEEDETVLS